VLAPPIYLPDLSAVGRGMTAEVKFSSIRLLVISLRTWLGATATKVVYSFEDQQRQKSSFTLLKTNKGKKFIFLHSCLLQIGTT
jgi:hypothetical protein